MPAMPLRKSVTETAMPTRAETLRVVSSGSLAEVIWPEADTAPSPAHVLQQRLLRAYLEAPIHAPQEDRLPLGARSAIILGVAVSLWLGIGGAVALAVAFMG